eukprot:Hpha_TRINITY_DN15763_c4_g2::TRINITY_DN15763_c4_g2_i1::g.36965::m.36965
MAGFAQGPQTEALATVNFTPGQVAPQVPVLQQPQHPQQQMQPQQLQPQPQQQQQLQLGVHPQAAIGTVGALGTQPPPQQMLSQPVDPSQAFPPGGMPRFPTSVPNLPAGTPNVQAWSASPSPNQAQWQAFCSAIASAWSQVALYPAPPGWRPDMTAPMPPSDWWMGQPPTGQQTADGSWQLQQQQQFAQIPPVPQLRAQTLPQQPPPQAALLPQLPQAVVPQSVPFQAALQQMQQMQMMQMQGQPAVAQMQPALGPATATTMPMPPAPVQGGTPDAPQKSDAPQQRNTARRGRKPDDGSNYRGSPLSPFTARVPTRAGFGSASQTSLTDSPTTSARGEEGGKGGRGSGRGARGGRQKGDNGASGKGQSAPQQEQQQQQLQQQQEPQQLQQEAMIAAQQQGMVVWPSAQVGAVQYVQQPQPQHPQAAQVPGAVMTSGAAATGLSATAPQFVSYSMPAQQPQQPQQAGYAVDQQQRPVSIQT